MDESDKFHCIVCDKKFYGAVRARTEGEYFIATSEDLLCSPECKKIHDETLRNKKTHCTCGKKVTRPTAWDDNYKKHTLTPICEECLDKLPLPETYTTKKP